MFWLKYIWKWRTYAVSFKTTISIHVQFWAKSVSAKLSYVYNSTKNFIGPFFRESWGQWANGCQRWVDQMWAYACVNIEYVLQKIEYAYDVRQLQRYVISGMNNLWVSVSFYFDALSPFYWRKRMLRTLKQNISYNCFWRVAAWTSGRFVWVTKKSQRETTSSSWLS